MEERVVNVPLVGGINQEDDIFSVQPPEMLSLVNVQAVKKGALDTRQGFNLVTKSSTVIEPATAFRDSSGTTQLVSHKIEAVNSYAASTGTRPVLAAGGKFYEYVGSDATHGFREVNDLSEYVGTLTSVSSTGGSIIEIESLLFDDETKRITVWVTGKRTGQELSSDQPMLTQVAGAGNAVYYSIQNADTEAYIVPPTRLSNALGDPTDAAVNLRLIAFYGASASRLEPMAFWWNYTTGEVECCVFELGSGAPRPTATLPRGVTLQNTHRNFDVVALYQDGAVPYYTFMYALCEEDTGSNVTPAKVEARIASVNGTTGVVTSLYTQSDVLYRVAPVTGFAPWGNRGVVLEQKAEMLASTAPDWAAAVSIGVRVVSVYYSGGVQTPKLDGQLALGRLEPSRSAGVHSISVNGFKYIPLIGFQTNDDLSSVLASASAPYRYSGSPRTTLPAKTSLASPSFLALPQAGPFNSDGTTANRNSEWTIAVTLSNGDQQSYMCALGVSSDDLYTLTPSASRPFAGLTAGLDGSNQQFQTVREYYPQTAHAYPGDQNLTMTALPYYDRQVNLIDIEAASVNTGFTSSAIPYTGVDVLIGGVVIATATVLVVGGSIVSVAIENPIAGPGPGYAFAGPPGSVTGIQFGAVIGAGTLTGAKAWNLTKSLLTSCAGEDIPNRASTPAGTFFYYTGQQEHCVHRWSVAHNSTSDMVLLSSCSATPVTNPQGDAPFGASSPLRYNNFCEFYRYTASSVLEYDALVPYAGGSSSNLSCALGGPWRVVGGLVQDNDKFYAAICPAGDDSQASTFLVRLSADDSVTINVPPGDGMEPYPSASEVTYEGNKGVFVEAANLMRVTAVPFNVPALRVTSAGITMGALRNGSSKGTQECFALDYEYVPQNYRTLLRMSDYTFINGGVLSVFDGANCNEVGMLVWPQRDLTSISWGDGGAQVQQLAVDPQNLPFERFQSAGVLLQWFYPLYNITRPYWFYEAGLYGSQRYGQDRTSWGGDPSDNYEAVYADLRLQQFSSFTKPGYSGGANLYGAHYYGRFQNTPTDFSNETSIPLSKGTSSYFLWAPRAARGWTDPVSGTVKGNGESSYTQNEAGGDFLVSWCYEYADGTGRMVRSAPSSPTQFTVCAEVFSSSPVHRDQGKKRAGGLVTLFKWGFFAPRMELTNRLTSASEDPRRVLLQPYATCEPFSTVMYRMPWANFENPISDFVVPRNATRGVVARAASPYSGSIADNPCGYVARNMNRPPSSPGATDGTNAIFDGPTGDYMGMLREPYLYTTGGVLDNVATPGCKAMCVHQNRLVISGADDPTVVWFSKELSPTDAVGFNDLLTLTIEAGGAVTGLASMNSSLFVFKKNDVYVISGSMPDATGNSSSLSEPTRLPSGIGCIDHRSVLSTPIGIFFQSTRSIELLTPDLQIRPIGDKVLDRIAQYPYITCVSHNSTTQEVYFVCQVSKASRADTPISMIVLVYSYLINAWYEWRVDHMGAGQASMTVIGQSPWIAMRNQGGTQQAYVYQQIDNQYSDGLEDTSPPTGSYQYSFIQSSWTTAPFALNQVQGFQRAKRCRLLARFVSGTDVPGFRFLVSTDLSAAQTSSWTSAQVSAVVALQNAVQLETHIANQKGQLIALSCLTLAPTAGVTQSGRNVRFSNIALVVGLKAGLNKRITEEAKH